MKRQQIIDRNEFDYEDRKFICAKSNNVCAHCGTPIQIGKNATIDHFIPLKKGGINQKLNTIPLCKKCNQEKNSKIINPETYIKFLKPKYKKELEDYYDSYIHSFEYVSRGNLFCCDQYILKVYTGPKLITRNQKKKLEIYDRMSQRFVLDRVYPKELPEVEEFFINYLKHVDFLKDEDTARKNIKFWRNFGVMYVIRNKEREIKMLIPITMETTSDKRHHLNLIVFSRYSNETSIKLLHKLPYFLSSNLIKEQQLPYIRFRMSIIRNDSLSKYLEAGYLENPDSDFVTATNIYMTDLHFDVDHYNEEEHKFYQQFTDVKKHLDDFFSKSGYEDMASMGNMVISNYDRIRELELEERKNNLYTKKVKGNV